MISRILLCLLTTLESVSSCALYDGNYVDSSYVDSRFDRDITTNCGPNDVPPVNRVNTSLNLYQLRQEMIKLDISAYIIPLDEENRLAWISGFTSSSGSAVVTLDEARLWTDGRYFLQASNQLDCNWFLMRMGQDGVPSIDDWIAQTLNKSQVTGADPQLVGAGDWLEWMETLADQGLELVITENLIDKIWTEENGRPPVQPRKIVVHDMKYAGENVSSKMQRLREKFSEMKVAGMLVTELDEVAWLFNLRGEGEASTSPFFESMALLTMDEAILWLKSSEVTEDILGHLNPSGCQSSNSCVKVNDIKDSIEQLEDWFQSQVVDKTVLVTSPSSYLTGANYAIYNIVPSTLRKLEESPILLMKSTKNEVENEGMMAAHVRDAVALCDWAAFMENEIQELGNRWTEISAAKLLKEYRMKQQDNKGLSFETIAAFGSNGAVIHYRPENSTDKAIDRSSLFLVDSGGQYLDGTTDVTRTFHYGKPTQEEKDRYTEVLRGAINLALVKAPEGTLDTSVDLATRQFLYNQGLEYRHGTGHGIGSYLAVHEGPTRIAMKRDKPAGLLPGMFFSDEPGFYKDGYFGIRLETILKVVPMDLDKEDFGPFIAFEPVTLVPFEPKLINFNELTREEVDWLNNYNSLINIRITTILEEAGNSRAVDWIKSRTQFIENPRRI